ncbi:uncharacterized protein LOC120000672 [Tripterygium wilfordii]|uniref:uncharacterized protein LOC120000672 n=1 Tax=Tripterygium wilfordii TaxID=458696 RepID=UPI0018F7EA7A|nr:uncharacterized protein LOC120000672 [Tripterygium wilfordii]
MENVSHALLECKWASVVWQEAGCVAYQSKERDLSFEDWLSQVLLGGEGEVAKRVMYYAWAVWTNKNSFIFEGKWRSATSTINFVEYYMAEYDQARASRNLPRPEQSVQEAVKWAPPSSGTIKLSVDRAVFNEAHAIGVGAVIRDHNGQVCAALSECMAGAFGPQVVKAYALMKGTQLAIHMGVSNLIIESDSHVLVNAIRSEAYELAPFGHILDDIRSLISCIGSVSLRYTRRLCNRVAHKLARNSINFDCPMRWIGECPDFILSAVIHDSIPVP